MNKRTISMSDTLVKKTAFNTCVAIASQAIAVIVGLFLPQALMLCYGSPTNGLITSLQQIVSYLTLIEGGLTGSLSFALYKPMAKGDQNLINTILSSARKQYNRIGLVFLIALCVLAVLYPVVVNGSPYSYGETLLFVLLLGVNGATQVLFIGKYKALFMASQRNGLSLAINSLSTAAYSLIIIVAAYAGCPAIFAVAAGASAYVLRAFAYWLSARVIYPDCSFNQNATYRFKQQGDVFAQQIMAMLILNSPVIILTVLQCPLDEISVYTTYNLVLQSVFLVFYSIENSVTSSFGAVIASGDLRRLRGALDKFYSTYFFIWTIFFSCVFALFLPFIQSYTVGMGDVEYVRVAEITICALIGAAWTLRNMQTLALTAAGKYSEMRRGFIVETVVTVFFCTFGYLLWGLVGLLVGRLVGASWRFFDLSTTSCREVLEYPAGRIGIRIVVAAAAILVFNLGFTYATTQIVFDSLWVWLLVAAASLLGSSLIATALYFPMEWRNWVPAVKSFVGKRGSKHVK